MKKMLLGILLSACVCGLTTNVQAKKKHHNKQPTISLTQLISKSFSQANTKQEKYYEESKRQSDMDLRAMLQALQEATTTVVNTRGDLAQHMKQDQAARYVTVLVKAISKGGGAILKAFADDVLREIDSLSRHSVSDQKMKERLNGLKNQLQSRIEEAHKDIEQLKTAGM